MSGQVTRTLTFVYRTKHYVLTATVGIVREMGKQGKSKHAMHSFLVIWTIGPLQLRVLWLNFITTFITARTAPIKLGQTQKQNTPLERANQNKQVDQLLESYTKVSQSTINLKIVIIIRFCMADNWQGLPVHHTNPYLKDNFQNDGTSHSGGSRIFERGVAGVERWRRQSPSAVGASS